MKILGFDTSSTACSVALLMDDHISALHKIIPMQQAQSLLPMIEELLLSHKITLNQLDAIAFGCGPGSFTGVRIAASVAQGLAYALELPVIPISSLAALAQAAYQELQWKKLLVAVDARMQEVYWGAYGIDHQGLAVLINKEAVSTPQEISSPESDWYGVGNAWEIYKSDITYQPLLLDTTRLATAEAIVMLAKAKYLNKEWVRAEDALPVYLRETVAKKLNAGATGSHPLS